LFRLLTVPTLLIFALVAGMATPATAKYASIVVDAKTGRILHSVNETTKNYPASLTKIMTLYMTFEAIRDGKLKLDQMLPVSRVAAGRSPSKLYLKRGDKISVEDAISALVTKSANDVATVLAEAMGQTERKFARLMTERANALGMKDTTFRNASGLPHRGQLSTALDMAILARALLQDFPREYRYFAQKSFTWDGKTHKNHNKLLETYQGADGIKTGYIRAAGFNLVASAKRNGVRVIAVLFGGKTPKKRNAQVAKLMDEGFRTLSGALIASNEVKEDAVMAARLISPAAAAMLDKRSVPAPAQTKPIKVAALPKQTASLAPAGGQTIRRPAQLNSWAVQVGAYNRYAPAHFAVSRAARAVPSLLGSKFAIVKQKSSRSRGPDIYKARLLVQTESRARQSCDALKRRKIDCMVIWMGPADANS
jgi:D-alanyl-D-alanine carboxypeptidase